MVDTCAAEFEAKTPYFYSTFERPLLEQGTGFKTNQRLQIKRKLSYWVVDPTVLAKALSLIIVVYMVLAIKECGYEAIMINCNPETVSTDFDMADKLYFEPVYWEHIWEIIEHEKPAGVIVQLGGQTGIKISKKLFEKNIPIIGTSLTIWTSQKTVADFRFVQRAWKFLIQTMAQPEDVDEAIKVANQVGYPVLYAQVM
jgi:carbamoyl-phosphate synthase large subunit